jgi:hypothetical protein
VVEISIEMDGAWARNAADSEGGLACALTVVGFVAVEKERSVPRADCAATRISDQQQGSGCPVDPCADVVRSWIADRLAERIEPSGS